MMYPPMMMRRTVFYMARNKYDIDETLEAKFDMGRLRHALRYTLKYALPLTITLILSAASSVINLIGPLLIKDVTDKYIPEKDINGMIKVGITYIFIIVFTTLFNAIRGYLTNYAGQHIVADMRHDLFAHLQKLPFSYYDGRPHGKILVRVTNYVNEVADFLTSGLVNFVIDVFSIIIIMLFMLSLDPLPALITIMGIPFIAIVVGIIKPLQHKAKRTYNNKSANYHAYLNESITGIRITQVFSRENFNQEILNRLAGENKSAWMKRVRLQFLVPVFIDNISIIFTCILYYVSAILLNQGTMMLGTLLAMTRYAGRFWAPIINIGNLYSELAEIGAYLERIFETMDEPVDIQSLPGSKEYDIKGDVSFKDVSFEYEKGRTILHEICFDLKNGDNIALVGPTGSGKTTIVNLISRFYEVTNGNIFIDGKDIREYTIASLRSQMGIMLQDTFLFSGTVRDNIRYGNLEATDEEIEQAAKAVQAHDFIISLSNGYDTEISEQGQSLSAGQRQLLSFARTLVSHPKILILDEATSTIDTQTEKLLQEGIKVLMKGRTAFMIAHRLSTIRSCDRIMYIENGNIAETGSHEELMEKKGLYYNLYTSQLEEIE